MDEKPNGNGTHRAWPDIDQAPLLEELVADLVHKLNNPLAAILGYAELVLPKIEDPEIKKEIEVIRTEAERASHIVRNLVASTKKRTLRKERVDLNRLVEEVLRAKADELRLKNIQVKMALGRPLPSTQVDPQQIKQVLINLINNAEEAISTFHGFGEIHVKTLLCDGRIEITFADDGPGIKAEDIPKIFSLFFTSKGKGMGMGLPISHAIILQHGGRMWGESEWGNGAAFHITLPITEENEEKGSSGRVGNLRGFTGLVIDDESPVLAFVSQYLVLAGAEIDTATNTEKALKILEEKKIDFIVCDMKMPGIDGEGFYRIVGEKMPFLQPRIIFSTGDVMGRSTKAFLSSIKNPWIGKPFDLEHLKETILDVLNSVNK